MRIKQLREKRNFTQSYLASKIGEGKDKQVVNRFENQGANPSAFQLAQLSKALNFGVEDFYNFDELDNKNIAEILLKVEKR